MVPTLWVITLGLGVGGYRHSAAWEGHQNTKFRYEDVAKVIWTFHVSHHLHISMSDLNNLCKVCNHGQI